MENHNITSVAVVGSGMMGVGIAEVCAVSGLDTVVVKATPGNWDDARTRLLQSLERRVQRGDLSADQMQDALSRVTFTSDRDEVRTADLVIESIVEDRDEKLALFEDLRRRVQPSAVLASNTSTLRIADLVAAGCENRTIGLHFFAPVPAMSLVELALLPETDDVIAARAKAFVTSLGKTAVPVLDTAGFVVNRLLVPYLLGAIVAYGQGIASASQIDQAMKLGCGHPMGPLMLCDLIGLDVVYSMSKLLYRELADSRYKPPALLRRMVQDGNLGKKTGLGFYDYQCRPPATNETIWKFINHAA